MGGELGVGASSFLPEEGYEVSFLVNLCFHVDIHVDVWGQVLQFLVIPVHCLESVTCQCPTIPFSCFCVQFRLGLSLSSVLLVGDFDRSPNCPRLSFFWLKFSHTWSH